MKLPIAIMLLAFTAVAAAADSPSAGDADASDGYAFRPVVEDYYPIASLALGEEGLTKLWLCHDNRGKPEAITVKETSGFARLDAAAVRYGRAVRITPAQVDGQPQSGCVMVPVHFSLPVAGKSPERREDAQLPPVQVPPDLLDIPMPSSPPPVVGPIPLSPSPTPDHFIPLDN